MDAQENTTYNQNNANKPANNFEPERTGRVLGGAVVVAVGSILLARQAGVEFPEWLFTWQMLVITIGVFVGAKNGFRNWGWLIPVTIGGIFLAGEFLEGFSVRNYWPIIIIVIGISMIFNSNRNKRKC